MAKTRLGRIGFIGAGRMGTGLIQSLLNAGAARKADLRASDAQADARARLTRATGITTTHDNRQVARFAPLVVLAVKPQVLPDVLAGLGDAITADHLVVSIAAGVRVAQVEAALGEGARVVRVMPNVACMVGEAASAYCLGRRAQSADAKRVEALLSATGRCLRVDETLMDAVTGLSGSGPAFAAMVIGALADGGVKVGLPRDTATRLAAQTVLGAARMILDAGVSPEALKDMVTSPGGTTIAGVHALEIGGLRAALIDAVEAATRRSRELGEPTQDT